MSLTPFSWILNNNKIITLSSSGLSTDSTECRTISRKISRLRSGKNSERRGWCGSTRQHTHGPRTRTAPQHLRYAKPTELEVKDKEDGLFHVGAHHNIDFVVIHNTIHVQAVELFVLNLYRFIFCEFAVLFTVLEYLEARVPASSHDELPVVDQCVDPAEMEDCGCFHTAYLEVGFVFRGQYWYCSFSVLPFDLVVVTDTEDRGVEGRDFDAIWVDRSRESGYQRWLFLHDRISSQ